MDLYGAGNAPDVGWWAYAPLASRAFSPGHSSDYWTIALLASGFGSIGTAINIIATIISHAMPGMTLSRMPLFAWMNLVMAGMVLARHFATHPRLKSCCSSTAIWAGISLIRRRAARPLCGCTFSGSLGIQRSTS